MYSVGEGCIAKRVFESTVAPRCINIFAKLSWRCLTARMSAGVPEPVLKSTVAPFSIKNSAIVVYPLFKACKSGALTCVFR
jgi:hypothetical protein